MLVFFVSFLISSSLTLVCLCLSFPSKPKAPTSIRSYSRVGVLGWVPAVVVVGWVVSTVGVECWAAVVAVVAVVVDSGDEVEGCGSVGTFMVLGLTDVGLRPLAVEVCRGLGVGRRRGGHKIGVLRVSAMHATQSRRAGAARMHWEYNCFGASLHTYATSWHCSVCCPSSFWERIFPWCRVLKTRRTFGTQLTTPSSLQAPTPPCNLRPLRKDNEG